VISPLLANIYLHYVLDLWAERWRRRAATGDMIIVRGACPRAARSADPAADDVVAGCQTARNRDPGSACKRDPLTGIGTGSSR
jgi:hypothetical protein